MDYEEEIRLSNAINHFSNNFFKVTSTLKPNDNSIMSPLSAKILLALLSLGTDDETLKELNDILQLSSTEFTKSAFKQLMNEITNEKGVMINVANKIYVKDGENFALNAEFKKDAIEIFFSDIENINFSKAVEAANIINDWVEKNTNNKIKNLLDPNILNDGTRLILVNAVYFKGAWKSTFDKENTSKKIFYLNSNETTEVDMMHQTSHFGYAELPELDAKVLDLPYKNYHFSLIIVLPNEVEGLKNVEVKLSKVNFVEDVLRKVSTVNVEVKLPRFKIESEFDLKPILTQLGIKLIFDPVNGNLNGLLANDERLYVSNAVQKAFIDVNEEGAEAAAATYMALMGCCAMRLPIETKIFNVDRPFYYALRWKDNILFHGKYLGKV